jgi:S-adenosylmethionine hydrolase
MRKCGLRENIMTSSGRIITLLTDFGLRDHYVAAMKGIILGLNPDARLVDISHLVPPQDIHTGAFLLGQSYGCFPTSTVHLAVVDPGVGTSRKVLVAEAGGHYFVAPDNGILSYVKKCNEDFHAYEVTADHYYRKPVSRTFHGRDIFAPLAAWVSRNVPLRQLGDEIEDPVLLKTPDPENVKEGLIQAAILAVDHFGNLITNLTAGHLPEMDPERPMPFKVLTGKNEVTRFYNTYGEAPKGELFLVVGSSGFLEISMKGAPAAATLGMKPGNPIGVVLL